MKMPEAIEILTDNIPYGTNDKSFDLIDALKLGIEALKRLHNARVAGTFAAITTLPGETRD